MASMMKPFVGAEAPRRFAGVARLAPAAIFAYLGLMAMPACLAQAAHVSAGGGSVGTANIGGAAATATVTFIFDSGGSLNDGTPFQVLTQGSPNLDFTGAAGSTCSASTTYSEADTCTVNVGFTPRFAGARHGAVILYGSSGSVIATAYVTGSGVGPPTIFEMEQTFTREKYYSTFPTQMSTVTTGNLSSPENVTVDGSGNVYVADSGNDRILKETPSGDTYVRTVVADGNAPYELNNPYAVAVDGAGNLYIADAFNDRVVKETPENGGYTQSTVVDSGLIHPSGIAVDGDGVVYVANTLNREVLKETPSGGGYTQSIVAPAGEWLTYGLAVDENGNVYVDETIYIAKETPTAGGYTESYVQNLPEGGGAAVAVDGVGNLYVAIDSYDSSGVEKVTPTGSVSYVGGGSYITISGVAVDGAHNVYIADISENRVLKEDLADPPSLSFAATSKGTVSSDSPQTIAVINDGNAPLTFPIPSTGRNPAISTSFNMRLGGPLTCPLITADSSATGTLAAGANCLVPIAFRPGVDSGLVTGTLTLTDTNLNASAPAYAPQIFQLTGMVLGTKPFGAISFVGDSTTISTTVAQSDSLEVQGWVADPTDGAPMSNVKVYIDGTLAGTPTLGIARPDVVATQENPADLYSGYQFVSPASGLSIGSHAITVVAVDSQGLSTTFGPANFTVAVAASFGNPFGGIGEAVDSTTMSSAVAQADSLLVKGWVADPQDGAPLSNVTVYIDGTLAGAPTLGIGRPDVAGKFGSGYLNSGYQLLYSAVSLSIGEHQVTAVAVDSGGRSTTFGPVAFSVAAAAGAGAPFGAIGEAVDSTTLSSTVSPGGSLLVRGFVADPADGSPLSNVKVYIDGVLAGTPTLGLARPDVVAAYHNAAYLHSGFQFVDPASSLAAGAHTVTVVAVDSGGRSKLLGPVGFTVE